MPNITTAFHIPTWITVRNINIGDVPGLYGIRGFEDALHKFIYNVDSGKTVGFQNIDVWSSIKLQCSSQQDQDIILHHKLCKHYSLVSSFLLADVTKF
jgi:hypothetical protein